MKKLSKKLATLFLTIVMTVTTIVPASAHMFPENPGSLTIQTYTLFSDRNVPVYSNENLTQKIGSVFPEDRFTIIKAMGDSLKIRYPTKNGNKEGWVKVADVSKGNLNNSFSLLMKAGASVTAYRRETGGDTIGSIDKGDNVYLVYAGQSRAQFIYPVSGYWKMGWVNLDELDKSGEPWRAKGASQVVPDGKYRISVSGTHSLDSLGPNNNVHVWQKLDVPQQIVELKHCGNGMYSIRLSNGFYLDACGGSTTDPTNLWGYPENGTPAQRFYIADVGDGRYEFFNVASGLALDVYWGKITENGANIQTWKYNGQSVALTRVDQNPPQTNTKPAIYNYDQNGWRTNDNGWNHYSSSGKYWGHLGVDYVKSGSNVPVCAVAEGDVVYSAKTSANGNTITIRHNINGITYYSFYAHMQDGSRIANGRHVKAGEQIGTMGHTGYVSGGDHVHLGIYTGPMRGDQIGYNKGGADGKTNTKFNDSGSGYWECTYKSVTNIFYDPQKFFETEGNIILKRHL